MLIAVLVAFVGVSGSPLMPLAPGGVAHADTYREWVLAADPISHWALDETSGTSAADAMGGNHGTIAGGVTLGVPGAVGEGTAMRFDGAPCTGVAIGGDHARLAPRNELSVESWVKTVDTGYNMVFRWRFLGYHVAVNDNGLPRFAYSVGSTGGASIDDVIDGSSPINDGAWHHLVATRDTETLTLYVDGQVAATGFVSGPIYYSSGGGVAIGRDGNACDDVLPSFTGDIDDVAVYGRALSSAEVRAHHAARSGLARPASEFYGGANPAMAGPKVCSVADPINCATGNFFETQTDLLVAGRGPALAFTRSYNALAAAASATQAGPLGWGWTHSYAMAIRTDASGAKTVQHANASTVTFLPAAGGFVAPARVISTLVANTDGTFTYTLPNRVAYRFGAGGELLGEADRNGHETVLSYGGGRLVAVRDVAGRELQLSYDAGGRVAQVTDPLARTVSYGYDADGDLASVRDVGGGVTAFTYDARHRLVTVTDPKGGVTTNVYDTSDRVTSQTAPMNRRTTLAYDGLTTTITDPLGNVTAQTFDANGNVVSVTKGVSSPSAATWAFAYDGANNAVRSTDPNGKVSRATWDERGNQLSFTDALGRTTTAGYNNKNDPTSLTDAAGVTTTMNYDDRGNLTLVSRPLVGTSQVATTTLRYDPQRAGDLLGRTDPRGKQSSFSYDSAGNLISATDPTGARATFDYNAIGWVTASVSPRGNVAGANPSSFRTTYAYNDFGDVRSVTDPLGHSTSVVYDAKRNRTSVTDANGHSTAFVHNASDEVVQTRRADASIWSTDYDAAGNVIAQIDGLGRATTYAYDAHNRPVRVSDPLGRSTTATYDGAGNLRSATNPANQTKSYAYDGANRLTNITYSDGTTPNVSFTYDANGMRTAMTDGSGTTRYTWDSLRRLTVVTDGSNRTVEYRHDLAGNVTSILYPANLKLGTLTVNGSEVNVDAGPVTRAFDDAGRLATVTDWKGRATRFSYDADGHLVGQAFPNGISTTIDHDAAGRPTSSKTAGAAGTVLDLPYTRDAAGLLTATNATASPAVVPEGYGYDALDRLTSASVPNQPSLVATSYRYDNADNLTRIDAAGGVTTTLNHDEANQLVSASQTGTGSSVNYSHDSRGNRTGSVDNLGITTTLSWDQENRLVAYDGPPVSPVNSALKTAVKSRYTYDGDGLRSDLVWDPSQGLPLVLVDDFNIYVTGPGGLPIAKIDAAGNPLYYHADQLGSTRALTDQSGVAVVVYNYDAYGNASPSDTEVINPFQFAGQYTDLLTGLIYMRARYYDPSTGHFISRDPKAAESGQPYAYANNSPHNFTDPSGEIAFLAVVAAAWAVFEVGSAVVDAFSTARTLTDPCASGLEKFISGGLFAAGAVGPGGGYSTGARAAPRATSLADDAVATGRTASTSWGRTIDDFQQHGDHWRRVSAHAEGATGRAYRGGTSIEEVFERGGDRLIRHRIYGPNGEVLHETFRPDAKFGAP